MTEEKELCPDCGSEVKFYHDTERTRVVCKNKCNGWKVIRIIERKKLTHPAARIGQEMKR